MRATRAGSAILTFLIADVRGYTSFTQEHGDEAAARLAAAFAELAREGVEAHGGDVVELRGDEALAVFSSPRDALRAAVELQLTFADELARDPALPLRVGIGLDAGEAVPVQGGYRGGALNLAARLCSGAGAGEVWVSQGVAHVARAVPELRLHEHGEIEMKGLAEAVRVFRAAPANTDPDALASRFTVAEGAVRAERSELPAALDPVTPIIGRDAEVRRVRWQWRRARRGKRTGAVIVGPTGIGKTRLAAEVAATAADSGARIVYVSYAEPHATFLREAGEALAGTAPTLVVLDDLESAGAEELDQALRSLSDQDDGPVLVVAAFDDERAPADLLARVKKLGEKLDLIWPQPLDAEAVQHIAQLYLGADAEVPAELLAESGGVPSRVHEQLGTWAHDEAARRLGAFASRAATRRSDLRSVEADLASSVVDLQLAREQARLFAPRGAELAEAPYKGLASFDVVDAEWFFGRERLVADLVARLAGAALLGVVGPSGSGKSSAVRAGLVPALRAGVLPGSEGWCTLIMRPSDHPLRELDRTLWAGLPAHVREALAGSETPLRDVRGVLRDEERVVLVVDQFEEVFTACRDESERTAFLDAIAQAASEAVVVVLALRADFYGRCAAVPALAERLGTNHVLVGPPTPDEYRRAIEQPALRAGARIEPALVQELVAEVVGEPGALPLLSTALLELWERRAGRTITRQESLETGGVHGAVARLAEDAYGGLTEEEQLVARGVFLRLAAPGDGDEAVRRRVPLSEFDVERSADVARVVDVLTARRLVTVSEGTVEVAHEALLREWPRFRQWLDEDREGRRLHAHLTTAAREWANRDQDAAELYRGARLSAALDWTTDHTLELNELEREFVNASRLENERDLVDQRRRNRRLRVLLAGTGVLLVLAVLAGFVALAQRASAKKEARVALARELGAEAVSEPRIDRAMLLARQSVELDRSLKTEGTLLATLLRSPAAIGVFTVPIQVRPLGITVSPDGRRLLVVDNNNELLTYDTRTRRQIRAPLANHGAASAPVYTRDGSRFVAGGGKPDEPPGADLIDARTFAVVRHFSLAQDKRWMTTPTGAEAQLLSRDERTVLYAYEVLQGPERAPGPAYLDRWDVDNGKFLGTTSLDTTGMREMALADGGRRLVIVGNSEVTLRDAHTMRKLRSVPFDVPGRLNAAAVAPDAGLAAVGTMAGSVFLLDLRSGRLTQTNGGHQGPVLRMAFTPDGRTLVSTGDDANVILWDRAFGTRVETLSGHGGRALGLTFSADGQTLYTCSLDGAIFAWDLGVGRRFGEPFATTENPQVEPLGPDADARPPLAQSPDGSMFAVRVGASTVRVYSARKIERQKEFRVPTTVIALAWSRTGELAVVGDGGFVQLWNVAGRPRLTRKLKGLRSMNREGEAGTAVAFSPDGRLVAAGDVNHTKPDVPYQLGAVAVWDTSSGKLRWSARTKEGKVFALAFSPDGRTVVVGREDGGVVLHDARTGRVLRTQKIEGGVVSVAYSPDGTLATGTWSGIVQLWEPETGAEIGHPTLVAAAPVSSISFDPTGSVFATTGGSDGVAKLWTTKTQQQFGATLPGSPGTWGNAVYTPDGSKLLVVFQDGKGFSWPTSLDALENHACAVAGRNFTREEWARYVTGRTYRETCR